MRARNGLRQALGDAAWAALSLLALGCSIAFVLRMILTLEVSPL